MGTYNFDSAFDLSDRVVLVTGGAAGIGQAIAQAFCERGASVIIADRNEAVTQVAAGLPGANHLGIVADITKDGEPERIVNTVVEQHERIDVLVNNAGINLLNAAENTSDSEWDRTMAINLRAPFTMARAAFNALCQSGNARIINLASHGSFIALDRHVAYCTSKAGLVGMTKVLAVEWAKHGITVNAISPTVVETELGRKAWAGEVGVAMKRKIPAGRFAQPEEIAMAALYLASGAAGMITGENLVIDGGYTIQ